MRIKPNAVYINVPLVLIRITIGLFIPILCAVVTQAAFGADFWEKKDYTEWSEKECRKLLTNSPWAKQYTLTETLAPTGRTTSLGQATRSVTYQIQLYSALPIRQAIVRQFQIAQNYEQLSREQKNQFDRQFEPLLGADNQDVVVLNISFMTDYQPYEMDLARYWQIQTTDLLKSSTYLKGSKDNTKVPISNFAIVGTVRQGFRFIFPRKYEDGEILEPEDKSLLLEFLPPVVGNIKGMVGFVEFKTKKMLFNGKMEY